MMDGMSSAERVKTLGLCMIVKNEAHVILRCLDSVRPLVDYLLIEDTGSTDGTQQIVMDWLSREGLPGEIVEESWRDFAYNRSHALARLREIEHIDYALIIDADDILTIDSGANIADIKKTLSADSYSIDIRHGPIVHQRTHICSNKLEFLFRGVVHEFLDCASGAATAGHLKGISISIVGGGGRSNDPDRYRRDAELIEKTLSSEEDPFLRSRYTFYLAQSYKDAGETAKALEAYLKRAGLGFWNEEVYVSLLCAGRLKESLNYPFDDIIATYQRATDNVPSRAEAIHGASRYCRYVGRNREGYTIGKKGIGLSLPRGLFVEEWIYNYGLLDEFAINAYWAGHFAECLLASENILLRSDIDDALRKRVEQNAAFARERLAEEVTPASGPRSRKERRYAFITPYYKETRDLIEQCIASVWSQTVRADHILVADGFPQDWIDQVNVRHVRLDRAHADWGNTPRCIGALMAAAEDYDGIGFLDADCWLEPDHLESCLSSIEELATGDCAYVVADRTLRRPDGSVMNITAEPPENHADTNSLLLLPAAYPLLSVWALMPHELVHIGDRVFYLALKSNRFNTAFSRKKTVNYICTYATFYRALGEEPPQPVKENPDHGSMIGWIKQLSEAEVAAMNTRVQANIHALYDPTRMFEGKDREPPLSDNEPKLEPKLQEAKRLFQLGQLQAAQHILDDLRSSEALSEEVDYYLGQIERSLAPVRGDKTFTLLWRCDNRLYWELDWIKELLGDLPYTDRTSAEEDIFADHMIVCDNRLTAARSAFYRSAYMKGCRVYLIHLSDENYEDDCSTYRWCEKIFRNYYSSSLAENSKLVTFPPGYKSGFTRGLRNLPATERAFVWSFAGHQRVASRAEMLDALAGLRPSKAHLTGGFNAPEGLSLDDYRDLLKTTLFAPCPAGFSSVDTFRVYEALEAGCIPIVERRRGSDYFRRAYGAHPMPTVEAWSEATDLMTGVMERNEQEDLRQRCYLWWSSYKNKIKRGFQRRLLESSVGSAKWPI
jgi:glycosyltransferase involved in cell wall biosynthesis